MKWNEKDVKKVVNLSYVEEFEIEDLIQQPTTKVVGL